MSSNMSESGEEHRLTEEELDKKSGGESVEMNSSDRNKLKRKRDHRHTPQQIQAMEEFFRDCPHPDNKQRIELSQELGMEPLQVKFWFQNKRTQMKTKHDRQQNTNLRAENEKLRAENAMFRDALSNASCPACGRMATIEDVSLDERHLRMENARLRDEINRISGVAANYVGKPLTNSAATPSSCVRPANNLGTGSMFRGSSSKGKGDEDFEDEPENNTP